MGKQKRQRFKRYPIGFSHIDIADLRAAEDCDRPILVVDDMPGFFTAFKPKFVKRYRDLGSKAEAAEVRGRNAIG